MAKEINLASGSFELVPGLVKKVADKMDNNNKILISRGTNSTSEPLPVQLATDMGSSSQAGGKPYPGFLSTEDIRAMSMKSVVVDAIVRMRVHQLAKLPIKIVPKEEEPSRQISILNYRSHDLDKHPAFDDADRTFLRDVYDRLDPAGTTTQKRDMFTQQKDSFSPKEVDFLKYLQEKHDVFYKQREIDIKKIKKVLSRPDPHFTNTHTWNNLMAKVLRDLLTLDRGIIVKIRDQDSNIVGLMPVDGASIRPIVYEYGFIEDRAAYVQNSRLGRYNYLDKKDVIVMMMNPVTDMRFFGYGISPLEVLSQVVLADIYIDKNNTDYYRKGGTVPEIILNLEPIPSKEGMVNMYSQSQVDAVQREITSIMTGDFTQVPIISGAKLNVTDLKGSRRDMQFKELAEYIMRKICAVFQVSSQEVNLLEGMKTSDGEVQADLTRSKGLHTLMMSVSEYMTYEVIEEMRPQGDLKLWFEEPEEKEADKNWGTQLKLTTGVLTINEVRSKMGLPPVPWGDTPLQNLQKNWEPTPAQGGAPGALPPIPGMGGPGGPPGAPPAPGGPPGAPPAPGGPAGAPAPSPFSGAGAPPTMKSVFDRVQELDLDRSIFSNADIEKATEELYLKSVKLPTVTAEDDLLSNIVNYKGGEFTRTPEQSVRYFLKSHNLDTEFVVDSPIDDTMLFSRIEDGVIIADESGETPIPLTIAKSLIASNPKGAAMYKGSDLEEALEFAVVESMDAGTRGLLYENAYKYKPQRVSDAMIQEAKEIFLT